jgi:hemerythrin superfamily protein
MARSGNSALGICGTHLVTNAPANGDKISALPVRFASQVAGIFGHGRRAIALEFHAHREKTMTANRGATESFDAIALLKRDHRDVEALFESFENAKGAPKEKIAARICLALTIHAAIEEEIFYPAARAAAKAKGPLNSMLDEALVEHQAAKELIADVQADGPEDMLWTAKVKVLGEQIRHHVKEEESALFKEVRNTDIDLMALGKKMTARKRQLLEDLVTI